MCRCRREHGSTGRRATRRNGGIESDAARRTIGLLSQEGSRLGLCRHDEGSSCAVVAEGLARWSDIDARLSLPV
jgi:hypothetical protein